MIYLCRRLGFQNKVSSKCSFELDNRISVCHNNNNNNNNSKVQVGKDQEKAQSEKDSHSKNRGGKKPN